MPYVRSYYRRSQGAASVEAPAGARLPTVAVYDAATGSDLLKTRSARVTGVSFSTGLPGGFLECNFTVRASGARAFGIDTGQKVVVRRGLQVVWWGWVEDVQRVQRGRLIELAVSCLGPWQTLEQRLIDVDYADWYSGDAAIKAMLASVGTYISSDYSQIENTGINIADLTKTNWKAAELVQLVCEAGNLNDQPMLFGIYEPGDKPDLVGGTNLILNPDLEIGTGNSAEPIKYWTCIVAWPVSNTKPIVWDTANYVSATHGATAVLDETPNTTGTMYADSVECSASTAYLLSFWARMDDASQYVDVSIEFLDEDDIQLDIENLDRISYVSSGWVETRHLFTTPPSTVTLNLGIVTYGTAGSVTIDDVYISLAGTSATADNLPRAKLWARDLSDYDYVLWTGALASGLAVTETTRDLVNAVKASYGSSSYTALAQNGTSQTAYRRRDAVVTAGSDTAQTAAEAIRDAYLATYKDPRQEPASFSVVQPGAIRTAQGSIVALETVRAGDRLLIADGPLAGSVILLRTTRYSNGALSVTPEGATEASKLLARSITR